MNLPIRHRNHEIEELSERYLKSMIPISWIINPFKIDYGTDFNCEISLDKKVTGLNFTIQLKGKETNSLREDIMIANLKKSTINRWMKRLEPTLLVVYIVDKKEAYWLWVEENTFDLSKDNKSFRIQIPKRNKLSEIDWDEVVFKIEGIFSKKHLLYEIPKLEENNKMWKLYLTGKYREAIIEFQKIPDEEKSEFVWGSLSSCYYELFHYQEALVFINKALEINSTKLHLSMKGCILAEQGTLQNDNIKLNLASEIFNKLLNSNKSDFELNYNFANVQFQLKNYLKAFKHYLITLYINPNYSVAWKNLGSLYYLNGDFENELNCYEKALNIDPNLPEAIFSKGKTLFYNFTEKKDEGLKLMIYSTSLTERFTLEFPIVFEEIAHCFILENNLSQALVWNNIGLKNNPSYLPLIEQKQKIEYLKIR